MTDLFDAPAQAGGWGGNADIDRDRFGRPLVTPPGGGKPVAYTRATTYVNALDDKEGLMRWKARMTALGVASRPDLALAIQSTDPDDKRSLDATVGQALDAARASAAATTGTALHQLTERIDEGGTLDGLALPDEHRESLDAYRRATSHLEWVAVEQFRVNDELQIGGTADRLAVVDGKTVIADVKTGKIDYPGSFAMQLAVYAHSVPYQPDTGARGQDTPPTDTERGLIIHLPAGGGDCTLYWIDLVAGWEAVQLASKVRQWRSRSRSKAADKRLLQPYQPATGTPGGPDGADPMQPWIDAAATTGTPQGLRDLWRQAVAEGVDGTVMTGICKARLQVLE